MTVFRCLSLCTLFSSFSLRIVSVVHGDASAFAVVVISLASQKWAQVPKPRPPQAYLGHSTRERQEKLRKVREKP